MQPNIDNPSNSNAPTHLWSKIDRAYCISLTTRPDRRDAAKAQFERVGLLSHVSFILVERHPTDSEQGIFESHQACLKAGLAQGAHTIAVFEDDIIFKHVSPQALAAALNFMESDQSWDALFLGCFVKSSSATKWPFIRSIKYRCTAHAYIVTQDFARRIVQTPWQGKPYDDMLRDISGARYFAVYPAFGYQSDAISNNDKTPGIDKARRMLGGISRLQRLNEWTHRHMVAIIAGHVAAGLIALIVLFWALGQ